MTDPTLPRVGLALSGGGFRASLFHVGVLARLAELDLLREVQVISTVSGGSIIGALYYLHVRRLLQSKPDARISQDDYIDLIDDLWRAFAGAIAKNLRMQTFADGRALLRTLYNRRYSRSDRIAELYDDFLYAGPAGTAAGDDPVALSSLTIQPFGQSTFSPFAVDSSGRTGNDKRRNKVPALIINATTLNTGHNFQFTATWLGEPPALAHHGDLDRNLRLRRAYYASDRLPPKYQTMPLSVAVAASAAVPGIFPPLPLTDLYRDGAVEVTPKLVDGGVHDNQGIGGLLDPDHPCTHLIVSDASGQMDDIASPGGALTAVLKRSNEALMDRVREEQHAVIRLLEQTGQVRAMAFVHLKESLQQRELTWIGGSDKIGQVHDAGQRTPYGVHPRIQELLAGLRTDLDAFTEVEAYALIADGYLIARNSIDDSLRAGLPAAVEVSHQWDFLAVQPYLDDPNLDPSFTAQLEAGSRLIGKSVRTIGSLRWFASPWATAAAIVLACSGVTVVSALFPWAVLALVAFVLVSVAMRSVAQARGWRSVELIARLMQVVFPGILVPLLAVAVRRHLRTLTPMRLDMGRLERLRPPPKPHGAQRQAA